MAAAETRQVCFAGEYRAGRREGFGSQRNESGAVGHLITPKADRHADCDSERRGGLWGAGYPLPPPTRRKKAH